MTPDELAVHRAHLEDALASMIVANRKVVQIVTILNAYLKLHAVPGRVAVVEGTPCLILEDR